jgi:hypothetical protein
MTQVTEFDGLTGETVYREFTENEAAAAALEAELSAERAAETAAKAAADAAATEAAIAHAKSLGFTDEMIAVMYPNLGAGNE